MQPDTSLNQSVNPLSKHFRQPAIYFSPPSQGKYWPEGSIELNLSNQIAVYPMTTRDEIMIRTPDALLNGESIIQVIQSCCPQIKDAWKMPSIDVDAILIAIRIASYGDSMDLDSKCPNEQCQHENTNELNLTGLLDQIQAPNYSSPIEVNNLKIKLKPQNYFENNRVNMANFEEQQLLRVIEDESLSDDVKTLKFKQHLDRMIDLNLEILASGTDYIETDEGQKVYNTVFIKEFYDKANTKVLTAVRKKFEEFAEVIALPRPRIKCESCSTEYNIDIAFNYTNFFAAAS